MCETLINYISVFYSDRMPSFSRGCLQKLHDKKSWKTAQIAGGGEGEEIW